MQVMLHFVDRDPDKPAETVWIYSLLKDEHCVACAMNHARAEGHSAPGCHVEVIDDALPLAPRPFFNRRLDKPDCDMLRGIFARRI